jgi:hypothetical protein
MFEWLPNYIMYLRVELSKLFPKQKRYRVVEHEDELGFFLEEIKDA